MLQSNVVQRAPLPVPARADEVDVPPRRRAARKVRHKQDHQVHGAAGVRERLGVGECPRGQQSKAGFGAPQF